MANAILSRASSLNAVPSPKDPAGLSDDALAKAYYFADYAVMELRKLETDLSNIAAIAEFGAFVQKRIREFDENADAGPPAPPPPQPGMMPGTGVPPAGGVAPQPPSAGNVPQTLGSQPGAA